MAQHHREGLFYGPPPPRPRVSLAWVWVGAAVVLAGLWGLSRLIGG